VCNKLIKNSQPFGEKTAGGGIFLLTLKQLKMNSSKRHERHVCWRLCSWLCVLLSICWF